MPTDTLAKRAFNVLDVLAAPVLLLALWLLFLRNAWDGNASFALFHDNEFFLGPILSSMSESLRSGDWPLRTDTVLGGFPLYNSAQLTAFYPLYLTALPIYESLNEAIHSMHMITVMHLLIMEINVYILLRVMGISRLASLTGASLITFSANSFSYAVWVNIVAPYAWFPLFLAGITGLIQRRPYRRYAAITLIGIVMLIFASPSQPLIHAVFVAGIFSASYFWECHREGKRDLFWREFALPVAGLGLLCFLVVAPALVPPAAEFADMIRWIGSLAPVYGNDRIPFAAFEAEQLPLAGIGGVLFRFRGLAVGQQFIGLVAFGLAVFKACSSKRSWITNALVFIAVYSLVSSFGSNLGLGYLNYWIPGLNKIREPTRFLFLFQFATGILAAFALDELRDALSSRRGSDVRRRQWLALLALLLISALVSVFFNDKIVGRIPAGYSIFIFALLIAVTWLSQRASLSNKGILVASVWSLASVAMLMREVPWRPNPVSLSEYEQYHLASLDEVFARIVELDPAHEYRVIFGGEIDAQVAAMMGSYHGIRTLNAYVNPAPRQQYEQMYYFPPRTDNYARVLGAKYLICKNCPADAVSGYSYAESMNGYDIYASDDVLPHTYLVTHASGTFAGLYEFISKASTMRLDEPFVFLRDLNVASTQLPTAPNSGADNMACTSNEESRGTNSVVVSVSCGVPAMLVLNKFDDRNWYARVDGVKTPVQRVNGNQVGVQVVAGAREVEFYYAPSIVKETMVLSILAIMAAVLKHVYKPDLAGTRFLRGFKPRASL